MRQIRARRPTLVAKSTRPVLPRVAAEIRA